MMSLKNRLLLLAATCAFTVLTTLPDRLDRSDSNMADLEVVKIEKLNGRYYVTVKDLTHQRLYRQPVYQVSPYLEVGSIIKGVCVTTKHYKSRVLKRKSATYQYMALNRTLKDFKLN